MQLDVFEVREGSADFGPKLLKLCQKANIPTEVVPLSEGDVSIVSCHMELVLIERKSDSDLLGSATSGRLVNQCRRMSEVADIVILLIEGPLYIMKGGYVRGTTYKSRLRYSALFNQIMALQIELGVVVVQVQTKSYAAKWIVDCYRYFQKEQHTSVMESKLKPFATRAKGLSPKDEKLRILMAVPDVGIELAERLLHIYGSIGAVADAPISGLTAIPKVGQIIANRIHDALN